METRKIYLKPQNNYNAKIEKLRVAAYCRVSTDMDEQQTSFEEQVRHYTELIQANPDWELVDIYADEGITGTSAEKRPAFMRMVKDAEAGRFDLLVTKSISRFARNTVELIAYVRRLRELGIHLIFEIHKIDTRSSCSEMLLTILAAFAQEESRSISENTTWGIRRRFEEGVARWCRLYGYEKTAKGEYQIVPEQAAVVREIFDLYEHGRTIQDIRKHLATSGIKSPNGASKWSNSTVHTLLCNLRYTGDIILQKTVTENHLTHKPLPNSAEHAPQYFVKDHHTPIITRAQYDRCMRIMGLRRVNRHASNQDTGTCNQYPLGNKLRCPYCGSTLYQRNIPVQAKHGGGWCCEKGEDACHGFIIRSHLVEHALLEAYSQLDADAIAESPVGSTAPEDNQPADPAMLALSIKREHPSFQRVDFWWVDDLVDHIEFGAHNTIKIHPRATHAPGPQAPEQRTAHALTSQTAEHRVADALTQQTADDRSMTVFWKCGLTTQVPSGVNTYRDHPAHIAELYNRYLARMQAKRETGADPQPNANQHAGAAQEKAE